MIDPKTQVYKQKARYEITEVEGQFSVHSFVISYSNFLRSDHEFKNHIGDFESKEKAESAIYICENLK